MVVLWTGEGKYWGLPLRKEVDMVTMAKDGSDGSFTVVTCEELPVAAN